MADEVPSPEEIINGGKRRGEYFMMSPNGEKIPMTEDQAKVLSLLVSGIAFVFVGIKPTENGADFFTALHGDPVDLRNAKLHLPGQIEKLYRRKEIV